MGLPVKKSHSLEKPQKQNKEMEMAGEDEGTNIKTVFPG